MGTDYSQYAELFKNFNLEKNIFEKSKEEKKPEIKKPEIKYENDLMYLVKENPNAYRILLFLQDKMENNNSSVMCSYTVIQEALQISRTTAARAIKLLKDKKLIYVYKSGTSNIYTNYELNFDKKHCKIETVVILAESEQKGNV